MKVYKPFYSMQRICESEVHKIKLKFPYIIKFAVCIILIAACVAHYFPAKKAFGDNGEDMQTVTLDDAVQAAVKNNSQLKKIDISIDGLKRQKDSLRAARDSVESMLDAYDELSALIEDCQSKIDEAQAQGNEELVKQLTVQEGQLSAQLTQVQLGLMQFGITAPIKDGEERYEKITKTFSFGEDELDININNLQNSKKVTENSVKTGVRSLYTGILGLDELYEVQLKSYESSKKAYDNVCTKLKKGQASELDKQIKENDMNKAKLNADITKRKLDNMYMNLKGQIGISPAKQIKLAPYKEASRDTLSLDYYLKKALENRSEIVNASYENTIKQREFNTTKKHTDKNSLDFKEADEAQIESGFALKAAQNSVIKDIKSGYADVLKKEKDIESADLKRKSAHENLDKMKANLKAGYAVESNVSDMETACMQAESGYAFAQRDYIEAVYRLETACGIGPGYSTDMTGGK